MMWGTQCLVDVRKMHLAAAMSWPSDRPVWAHQAAFAFPPSCPVLTLACFGCCAALISARPLQCSCPLANCKSTREPPPFR